MAKTKAKNNDSAANLGLEAKLWQMADGLHVVVNQNVQPHRIVTGFFDRRLRKGK